MDNPIRSEFKASNHPRAAYYQARKLAAPWRDLLRHAKARAARRGLPFTLTDAWAEERWTGHCELTGMPFEIVVADRLGARPLSPSLDRIDKHRGWVPGNCRFILASLAAMRGYMTDREMVSIAARLAANAGLTDEDEHTSDEAPAPTPATASAKETAR